MYGSVNHAEEWKCGPAYKILIIVFNRFVLYQNKINAVVQNKSKTIKLVTPVFSVSHYTYTNLSNKIIMILWY